MTLHPLDVAVIVAYAALTLAIGLRFSQRNQTTDRYFLGGRDFPGWAIGLSFIGIAAFATAAAAGTMYLVQRHELKSRRFGTLFRFFPPLATLDRVATALASLSVSHTWRMPAAV